jgi:oligopeptide transport system substrate-binding protein
MQARKLLADAGYPDGTGLPELTFTFNESREWRNLASYLQRRWGEVLGIRVRARAIEWSAFLGWPGSQEWIQQGDLLRGGWFSEIEDPSGWYSTLWDSGNDPAAFSSGWQNQKFNELVRQGSIEVNPGRRSSLYAQAESILAGEYPAIPVFHYGTSALVKPYVKGFQPDRVMSTTPLRTMSLSD